MFTSTPAEGNTIGKTASSEKGYSPPPLPLAPSEEAHEMAPNSNKMNNSQAKCELQQHPGMAANCANIFLKAAARKR